VTALECIHNHRTTIEVVENKQQHFGTSILHHFYSIILRTKMGGTNDNHSDDGEMDSADEALLSMLGLPSMDVKVTETNVETEDSPEFASSPEGLEERDIVKAIKSSNLVDEYQRDGVCLFPSSLRVPPTLIRRLTDELVWGGDKVKADKSYETIQVWKEGDILERRTLTRLENFVDYHDGWSALCHGYLKNCISALLGEEMVLFKEKLNLKPPGGSGFAPHLDGPSLRVALGNEGPRHFVTVMVAIDNMTSQNGCLRLCKGAWSEENAVKVIPPEKDASPDAGGRAGAISSEIAESLDYDDLVCDGGSIAAFSEWTPHRSAANTSPFPRRAVFLTYNPASEGDHHANYYNKMEAMRNEWRSRVGLTNRNQWDEDHQNDLDALATVPGL
jgi:Phytanoyl-CoA dioxygenase (PhyH)